LRILAVCLFVVCLAPATQPDLAKGKLTAKELEQLWTDLGDEDAEKAFRAMIALQAAPAQATAFLNTQLQPVKPADPKLVQTLITDLNSPQFTVRDKATKELEKMAELVRSALEKALSAKPTLETRQRIEGILQKLEGPVRRPDLLRGLRALEVLERIGTSEARKVVQRIASGASDAIVTQDAKETLARMPK
jgi:hypothetical protein